MNAFPCRIIPAVDVSAFRTPILANFARKLATLPERRPSQHALSIIARRAMGPPGQAEVSSAHALPLASRRGGDLSQLTRGILTMVQGRVQGWAFQSATRAERLAALAQRAELGFVAKSTRSAMFGGDRVLVATC